LAAGCETPPSRTELPSQLIERESIASAPATARPD
jgi:hypothetical protein